jgi:hypothetical protein
MRTLAVAVVAGAAFLTLPAAAQTSIGGPHKQINQLGGAKVVTNPVVSPPRASSLTPPPAAGVSSPSKTVAPVRRSIGAVR